MEMPGSLFFTTDIQKQINTEPRSSGVSRRRAELLWHIDDTDVHR
jgi:hypothetical protein